MNFRLPPLSRNDFQMKEMEVLKEKLESKKPIDLIHVTCHLPAIFASALGLTGVKQCHVVFQGANKRQNLPIRVIALEFVYSLQKRRRFNSHAKYPFRISTSF